MTEARHGGRVDDVALVVRVAAAAASIMGVKAHAVHDAHQVHVQHPLPVGQRVLPDQAATTHAGVVEDEVRGAKTLRHLGSQGFHLCSVADIQLAASTGWP